MPWLRAAEPVPATVSTYAKPTGTDPANPPIEERWVTRVDGAVTWTHYTPRGDTAVVSSDAAGPVTVELTLRSHHPAFGALTAADVHVQQEGVWPPPQIAAEVDGNIVSFTLPAGFNGNVWVVTNDRYEPTAGTFDHYQYHLSLGVLPLETWTPTAGQVTHYFGPGIHTGSAITLSAGQTVYIAGGALVRRSISTAWEPSGRVANVRVGGRGVVDLHPDYNVLVENGLDGGNFVQCDDLTVEGITWVTKGRWGVTPFLCDGVTIQWIRAISCEIHNLDDYGGQGTPDGVDPVGTSNMTLSNSFIGASDDSSAIKCDKYSKVGDCRDLLYLDLLIAQGGKSNAFDIGYELGTRTVERITYRRINIPMCYRDAGAFRTGGLSIHCCTKALVQDILYEDVWVQRIDRKDFMHWCATFYTSSFGSEPGAENRGTIQDVTYRRVIWPDYQPQIDVGGNYSSSLGEWFLGRQTGDGPLLSGITFEDCYFLDQKMTAASTDALGWRWVDTDVSGGITWL
jgi:hypothetical protein